MKIFAISGLGADQRVFDYLSIDHELIVLDWLTPKEKEPIAQYAQRLITTYAIDKEKEFGVLGVSFGGLIATEISKLTQPKITLLISSITTSRAIPQVLKYFAKLKLIEIIPERLFAPPKALACYLFGTSNKALLWSILEATDLYFTKWAIRELINWKNQTQLSNLITISGSKDRLLPPQEDTTYIIDQGAHFMIVDRALEISKLINTNLINPKAEYK